MNRKIRVPLSASFTATVLALAIGTAAAQGAPGGSSTGSGGSSGTGSSGSSTSGSPQSPMAQPGTGTRNTPPSSGKIARADRKFIEDAAASGLYEVQAAQLAATRATDPAIKDYASTMADHHSTANRELTQLANSKGLELPPAPSRSMRRDLEQLGKKSGAEFDREFVRNIGIREHERDIRRFQSARQDVQDPQLRAWIDKTLPSLEQQLAQAQKLPHAGTDAARSGSTGNRSGTMGAPGAGPTTSRPGD